MSPQVAGDLELELHLWIMRVSSLHFSVAPVLLQSWDVCLSLFFFLKDLSLSLSLVKEEVGGATEQLTPQENRQTDLETLLFFKGR